MQEPIYELCRKLNVLRRSIQLDLRNEQLKVRTDCFSQWSIGGSGQSQECALKSLDSCFPFAVCMLSPAMEPVGQEPPDDGDEGRDSNRKSRLPIQLRRGS
jgi:hypothetical protein